LEEGHHKAGGPMWVIEAMAAEKLLFSYFGVEIFGEQ
jgi:hypothetical protein